MFLEKEPEVSISFLCQTFYSDSVQMQDALVFVTTEREIPKRRGRRVKITFSKYVVMYCRCTRQKIEFKHGS
jgi:hypothetical protein